MSSCRICLLVRGVGPFNKLPQKYGLSPSGLLLCLASEKLKCQSDVSLCIFVDVCARSTAAKMTGNVFKELKKAQLLTSVLIFCLLNAKIV